MANTWRAAGVGDGAGLDGVGDGLEDFGHARVGLEVARAERYEERGQPPRRWQAFIKSMSGLRKAAWPEQPRAVTVKCMIAIHSRVPVRCSYLLIAHMITALVLAENEVTRNNAYDFWQDETGVRYHFPNQYRNRFHPGKPFVYYRGTRRINGRVGMAEYFGYGILGTVRRDVSIDTSAPKKNWRWFCDIALYVPFPKPVSAKQSSGEFFENVLQPNHWRNGVRELSIERFNAILAAAKEVVRWDQEQSIADKGLIGSIDFPRNQLPAKERGDLINPLPVRSEVAEDGSPYGTPNTAGPRRSKVAALVGRHAEELALDFIKRTIYNPARHSDLRWVSEEGLTPGWDIEFRDEKKKIVAIEVKGTAAERISSVEVTSNEWTQAAAKRSDYWIYLVTGCRSEQPNVQRVQGPYEKHLRGEILATPTRWRLDWVRTQS